MITKGTFTSVWDGGIEVSTNAELNTETGEVTVQTAVEIDGLNNLEREYFTDEDEDEHTICPDCHEYIMTTKMFDGIGKCYEERECCSNPDCESNN